MSLKLWKALPLNEYLRLTGELQQEDEEQPTSGEENDNILQYLSERNQDKGRKILVALKDSADLTWNATGDVAYKGTKIPNAHMADLLSFSLRTLPIKKARIPGLDEFMNTIRAMNLPKSLFAAPFLKLLAGESNEKSQKSEFEWKKFKDVYLLK